VPAYVIAAVDRVEPEAYSSEYGRPAVRAIESYGGKILTRGDLRIERLEGDRAPGRIVLIEFPTYDQAKEWYESTEYQQIIPLRQKYGRTHFISLVETV
jgi:uncharacterized protein (DUF1330 family)